LAEGGATAFSSTLKDHRVAILAAVMPDFDLTAAPVWISDLVERAASAGEDIPIALGLARDFGARLALPGCGHTLERWSVLARVAEVNLTVARVLEAHTDALAILAEAGLEPEIGTTWGVFAAEAPGNAVHADTRDGSITLTGTKPWCSLGGEVDRALVTAHVGEDRGLYQVDLTQPQVHVHPSERWVARGLRAVVSVPIEFDRAPATPVGEPGWYLRRNGFAWGGIGVAACWYGASVGLAAAVFASAARRSGELAALHAGIVDVALHAARAVLCDAARAIDSGTVDDPELLALRARTVVAEAAERILHQAGHALGPAPLGFDADHAARVADLAIYVRQHHGERDLAAIGARVTRS
jgi:alkylation response protein AidB-like acyl-CoA dehydrogenase